MLVGYSIYFVMFIRHGWCDLVNDTKPHDLPLFHRRLESPSRANMAPIGAGTFGGSAVTCLVVVDVLLTINQVFD